MRANAGKRRIKVAGVIDGEDQRAFLDHALGMDDPQRKEAAGEEFRQVVEDIIDDTHRRGIGRPFALKMPDNLVDNTDPP